MMTSTSPPTASRVAQILVHVLHESGFNRTAAARLGPCPCLGQIRSRIARLGIAVSRDDEPRRGAADDK